MSTNGIASAAQPHGADARRPAMYAYAVPSSPVTTRTKGNRRFIAGRKGPWRMPEPGSTRLLGRGREGGQLADVARVVLDDDRRFQVLGDVLDALERGDRLRAVEIEARRAVALVVLAEVRGIADQDDRALLLQPHEQ